MEVKDDVRTIDELIKEDEHASQQRLIKVLVGVLLALGLIFTGALNFMLYSRPFPGNLKVLALIPALLIEGSLALFLLGSFVWFAHGTQGTLAKVFGWLMFAIVGGNTVVEFNTLLNPDAAAADGFLKLYSFWGVPLVVVLVIGFWKAVVDADPTIMGMRRRREMRQAVESVKQDAFLAALGTEESRAAIRSYGVRAAGALNRALNPGGEVLQLPAEGGTGGDLGRPQPRLHNDDIVAIAKLLRTMNAAGDESAKNPPESAKTGGAGDAPADEGDQSPK